MSRLPYENVSNNGKNVIGSAPNWRKKLLPDLWGFSQLKFAFFFSCC